MRQKCLLFLIIVAVAILIHINAFGRTRQFEISQLDAGNVYTREPLKIGIIVVIEGNTMLSVYKRALDSVRCYSKIYGYDFIIAMDKDFSKECPHKDKFFRRHCVVAAHLPKYDYLLFLDADIGVINPIHSLDEFIDDRHDVTFYDRFYNQEIMAGSYLLKNTGFALDFIKGFADYEYKLPYSFHGTDNGALHIYLLSKLYPNRSEEYKICQDIYKVSKNYDNLFTYENCVRMLLGMGEEFGKIRILRKGTGWARDAWITNSRWNPKRDFMLHGMKSKVKMNYTKEKLPINITDIPKDRASWYDPIIGEFNFDLCKPGNTSWNLDKNLIAPLEEVESALKKQRREIQLKGLRLIAKIPSILKI